MTLTKTPPKIFSRLSDFSQIKGRVRENVLLKDYVYYGIGGPADIFVEPANEEDIRLTLELCRQNNLPFFILGSGTNLLIRDGGLRGVTLFLGAGLPGEIKIIAEDKTSVLIQVPAHWPKAKLLDYALAKGWSGLEFSAGIPGTIGGAVWMNAGTKWGSYGEVIERVKLYKGSLGFLDKSREKMGFKYRGHGEGLIDSETVIVSADLRLSKTKSANEIRALVDEILTYRGGKQPLELPNCGSVFKNPEDSVKGAGRLIEAAGLKGERRGQAMVSLKHANFILNMGNAKSKDVESLINHCRETVKKQFSIELEAEVIILGENS